MINARTISTSNHLRTQGLEGVALRSDLDIARISDAGAIVHAALMAAADACVPGAMTSDLDDAAAEVIAKNGADPLFLDHVGPHGDFPASTCISVEDEVVHGIPGPRRLNAGEIVSIDCGVRFNDWCADAAVTVPVGAIDSQRQELIDVTEAILGLALRMIRPGRRWSEIALALQEMTFDAGFGIVEKFCGHGIGRQLHEPPAVPCVLTRALLGRGDFTLRPGMVLAIEPILAMEAPALRSDGTASGVPTFLAEDGWTVKTLMGEVTSHFEHTIAVGRSGAYVLTAGHDSLNEASHVARIPVDIINAGSNA